MLPLFMDGIVLV